MNQAAYNPIGQQSSPSLDRLREAMRSADYAELEAVAVSIGREAVEVALAEAPAPPAAPREEAEAQRQRDLDAALADAIEVVNRARLRQGRRVCSTHDGATTRKVFELLRSIMGPEAGADHDPSFQ